MSTNYISAYKSNNEIHVWEKDSNGNRYVVPYSVPYYFYVPDKLGEYTSVFNKSLRKEEFATYDEFNRKREMYKQRGILLYESDIQPVLKVLTNTYADRPAPKLNYTLYDIEVDYSPVAGFSSVENPYAPINAVALHHHWLNKSVVIAVPPPSYKKHKDEWDKEIDQIKSTPGLTLILVNTERELLELFLDEIQDSDVLSGWNSDTFDAPYITKRIEKVFGKHYTQRLCFPGAPVPSWRQFEVYGKMRNTVDFYGRISLDYMLLFKKFEVADRPSFSLEAISNEILPELPKLEYEGSLFELYHNNFPHFLRYNYRDTEVLAGFENKLGYLEVANMLYHMSCGLSAHIFGTIRLADLAITLFCHNVNGKKVPDRDETKPDGTISGAMVLRPQMGMTDWLGSVDVTSLYPSAIRTINISPETLIGQMRGVLSDDDRMKHSAWQAIFEQSNEQVTLDYDITCAEDYSGSETMSGAEWFNILLERGWAISGYGTIFTQNLPGFIPAILTDWFDKRIKYKKLKDECKRKSIKLKESKADQKLIDEQVQLSEYYDRLQYIFKIKLNSLYGALTNYTFRYFDLRLGESTTGTGRCILDHMCSIIAKNLDGNYSFNSDSIIYGDSVAGDTKIRLQDGSIVTIESLYTATDVVIGTKEYCNTNNLSALTYDHSINQCCYKPIKYVMRHNVSKKMYRVWSSDTNYVDVTEDHSMMCLDDSGCLIEVVPIDLLVGAYSLVVHNNNLHAIGKVVKVEEIRYSGYVYDIEVGDTHVFFANDILVHNTDSCYFKTHAERVGAGKSKEDIYDLAVKIGDKLGDIANKSFPEFCIKAFRVKDEYSRMIKCEREVIGKRGIFVTKKRYVIKVVNLDGHKVNKLKAMGLEMKKTTTPKPFQKFTESVVNMILDGESDWDEIEDFIINFREHITDMPVFDVGLPKGVKGVEDYTDNLVKGESANTKVRLPGHVAASIHYNRCLEEFGDKDSPPIVSGTKIKVFYLKRNRGRFKSIAVPTDMGKIPTWMENDEFAVDLLKHEQKLIDGILQKIFDVLNKEVPTKQSKFNNSLMEW